MQKQTGQDKVEAKNLLKARGVGTKLPESSNYKKTGYNTLVSNQSF